MYLSEVFAVCGYLHTRVTFNKATFAKRPDKFHDLRAATQGRNKDSFLSRRKIKTAAPIYKALYDSFEINSQFRIFCPDVLKLMKPRANQESTCVADLAGFNLEENFLCSSLGAKITTFHAVLEEQERADLVFDYYSLHQTCNALLKEMLPLAPGANRYRLEHPDSDHTGLLVEELWTQEKTVLPDLNLPWDDDDVRTAIVVLKETAKITVDFLREHDDEMAQINNTNRQMR
jgi:hypothetical protein